MDVVEHPETHYAWNGDISLAYQVIGDGAIDLVYLQGYASHVDLNWESSFLSRFLHGLSTHARVVVTDRRGWGCSERFSPNDIPDVDELTDDIGAVMDAAGSSRAVLVSSFECSMVAALFAATYPERALGLILIDPIVAYSATAEMPWMPTVDDWEGAIEEIRAEWGTSAFTSGWEEGRERDWFTRYTRAAMTPGSLVAELRRYLDADIRAVLPTIQVPTLVCSDQDADWEVKPETGRFVASQIPGARFVEHSSKAGLHRLHWYARGDAIVEEVGRFLAELREEEASFDRVLATVLFTDIVDSTKNAAELGDRQWREVIERHHGSVRTLLARYRGAELDTAGDGFFASFDGPARAVRCAVAIADAVRPLGIEVRAGVHTGEVERLDEKVGGLTVSIGARVAALALPSEVLVSQTVKDLMLGSDLAFEDRGLHTLKGVPGEWRVHAVLRS